MFLQPNYENYLDKKKFNDSVKKSAETLKQANCMSKSRMSFEEYAKKRQEFLNLIIFIDKFH